MKTSAPVSMNMSNMTSLMEDYFTDVTYMTVTQGRLSVLFLLLTILAQIAWLPVKVHRLGTLVATLTFQTIPLCKAQTMDDQSTKVVCHNFGCQFYLPLLPLLAL